jgi:hypothetical protein
VNREASRSALQFLAAQKSLTDREALDAIGAPTLLHDLESANRSLLLRVLDDVLRLMPPDLAPSPVDVDDAVGAATDEGASLMLSAKAGPDSKVWVAALVGCSIHVDDEAVVDINALNIWSTGVSWQRIDEMVLVFSGSTQPADQIDDRWCRLVGDLFLTAQHHAAAALEVSHPSSTYLELQGVVADTPDAAFSLGEVLEALRSYKASTPPSVAPLVQIEHVGQILHLHVPFYDPTSPAPINVRWFTVAPDEIDMVWALPGVHFTAALPEPIERDRAVEWCAKFNGATDEPDDDLWVVTTPWMLGNWRFVDDATTTAHVFFHGFIPNRYRDLVDLEGVIDGAVRELWTSWDRYRLWKQFDSTVAGTL